MRTSQIENGMVHGRTSGKLRYYEYRISKVLNRYEWVWSIPFCMMYNWSYDIFIRIAWVEQRSDIEVVISLLFGELLAHIILAFEGAVWTFTQETRISRRPFSLHCPFMPRRSNTGQRYSGLSCYSLLSIFSLRFLIYNLFSMCFTTDNLTLFRKGC